MSGHQNSKRGPAAARYAEGQPIREPYLARARRQSRLTITSLFPESGSTGASDEVIAWQSANAWFVNNLCAKRVMALFPPGVTFVGLKPSREALRALDEMDEETRGKIKTGIEQGLSAVEQELVDACEEDGDRAKHFDAERHLCVGGNHCLKMMDDDSLQSISLDSYVTWRDKGGKLLEFVIEDGMAKSTLPPDILRMVEDDDEDEQDPNHRSKHDEVVNVYTHGRLRGGMWHVYQEVAGMAVDGSDHTWEPNALPYLFLREIAVKGEHYGRSYCEDYEADLQTLDAFWQILTEGSAAIARLVWAAKPGGVTNKRAFQNAQNGETITADPEDITAIRADKGGDYEVAFKVAEAAERRLEKVFLVFSQRSGERVTAEEIRRISQELEATQGGVYSNQVTTYQAPYARLKMAGLQRHGRVRKLPKGSVKVTVLTGDAALGRVVKSQVLREWVATMQALFPDQYIKWVDVQTYAKRDAANVSLDTDGLLRSEDKVAQQDQLAQQQALSQQVAPEVVRQGGQMLQNQQQQAQLAPEAASQ